MTQFSLIQYKPTGRECLTNMSAMDARRYFLKSSSYNDLDLPGYIDFTPVLARVSSILEDKKLEQFMAAGKNPSNMDGVNYIFSHNRDGDYAVRPYAFINPALYVSLVHLITEPSHWKHILKRFRAFASDKRITAPGIPCEQLDGQMDRCAMVRSWYEGAEQRAIIYSLDYQYSLTTDVADCHGSIDPSLVVKALHHNGKAKAKLDAPDLLGNLVAHHLEVIAGERRSGLPSGCMLMNFISELVLGYVDLQLISRVKEAEGNSPWNFRTIRFRDDYRIFVKSLSMGECLLGMLSEVLASMGMKLAPNKTEISSDVIGSAIKDDKLYWLGYTPARSLKDELLEIRKLSIDYPNSGSLVKALSNCLKNLDEYRQAGSSLPLIAILADIVHKSPRTYPIASALLSRFLGAEDSEDVGRAVLTAFGRKCRRTPNSGLLDIWLQRLARPLRIDISSDERLCRIVDGKQECLWNTSWLKTPLSTAIQRTPIVRYQELAGLPSEIEPAEVCMFP